MELPTQLMRWFTRHDSVADNSRPLSRRAARYAPAALLTALLAGCDADSTAPVPGAGLNSSGAPIVVFPAELLLDEGSASQLRVYERAPDGGIGREISFVSELSWRTSDGSVASVENGAIRAYDRGAARITVVAGNGQSASAEVQVVRQVAHVEVLGGDRQSGLVTEPLGEEVVVRLSSNLGRPVDGAAVGFGVVSGSGRTSQTDLETNAEGIARVRWTLGPIAGEQQLEVRVPSRPELSRPVRGVALPGALAKMIVQPENLSVSPGSTTQLELVSLDAFGNQVQNPPVNWEVSDPTVATVDPTGLITGLGEGEARVSVYLDAATRSQTADSVLTGPTVETTSGTVHVTTASRYSVSVTGDRQMGAVGTALARPIGIKVRHPSGKTALGVPVTWAVTSGGGTLDALRSTTSKGGVAEAIWVLGPTIGTQTAEARIPDHAPVKFIATALAGGLTRIDVRPSTGLVEVGDSLQYTAVTYDASGNPLPATVSWRVTDPTAASVASSGVVKGLAAARTQVSATSSGISVAADLEVTSGTVANAAPTASFTYRCQELACSFTDTSTDPDDQIVSRSWSYGDGSNGVGTAPTRTYAAAGTYAVKLVVTDSKGARAAVSHNVTVSTSGSPTGSWHRTLKDTVIVGDVVVPDRENWLIGRGVQIQGNLRTVGGTIAMRPGSSLKFIGANPAEYVGGGMTFAPEFARDIGLWIGPAGVLDIQCTRKTGWNRTGVDPTWLPTDEYWISPTAAGDHAPRRWYPGQSVPRVDARVPAAEVINVTRDCVIEGPGHIHINSKLPQRIEYVQLRALGIIQAGRLNSTGDPDPALTGRYALHLHMMGDGARGTIIRGVAAVDSRGRVFAPHTSHGVTMTDNVSVNSWAEAFWWDRADPTNDILVDRLAVCGATVSRDISGQAPRFSGIHLVWGERMEMRNSVVCGVRGSKLSVGFGWETGPGSFDSGLDPVWEFSVGNVAHNNSGPGVRFWNNSREPHVVSNFISYHNGMGIENGAYRNANRYADILSLGDGIGIEQHASSAPQRLDGGPGRVERCHIASRWGPAFSVNEGRNVAGEEGKYFEVIDCTLIPASGHPKVYVGKGGHPWFAHFVRSGVTPADVVFDLAVEGNNGSHVLIDHEDGRKWEILIQNGQKIVRAR